MVRLADLVHLPRPGDRSADLPRFAEDCEARGLHWPLSVIRQFLFDHGSKADFLAQYDHLELRQVAWSLTVRSAEDLLAATFYDDFADRVTSVATRPHWTLNQYCPGHGDVWVDGSWKVPPLFIDGGLRNPPQAQLHLVEGHTRLGVLCGLVAVGEVDAGSKHEVYLGVKRSL